MLRLARHRMVVMGTAVLALLAIPVAATSAATAPQITSSSLSDSYNTQTDLAFRKGLQIRLVWTGDYAGRTDGVVDMSTLRAIRDFQARHALPADGVIDEPMLRSLISLSDIARTAVGAESVDDGSTGSRALIPTALVSDRGLTDVGNVWRSDDRSVEVETVRIAGTGQTLRGLFDVLIEPTTDRRIANSQFGTSWFTLDGVVDGRFYFMRFEGRGDDLRGYTISYTPDRAQALRAFVTVASSQFEPFAGAPASELVASAQTPSLSSIIRRDVGVRDLPRYANANAASNNPHLFELPEGMDDGRDDVAGAVSPAFDMAGSGFVVSKDGWLLTNAHVVRACRTVMVGSEKAAGDIVFDPQNDLALLKIRPVDVKPLSIAPGKPRLGEDILALGYPLRSILADSLNVTRGNVSSLLGLMNDPRYLQISAPVQPGNSGGPLVDLAGRVVGVVTAKLNAVAVADATGDIPQAINFAIRPDAVTGFLRSNGVRFSVADASEELKSVPEATADVKDAVMPILCLND